MLRTHNCAQLRESDIDKEVTLCGWVDNRRDHGKLIFIDIRDRFGITQVVFIPQNSNPDFHAKANQLRSEFVIKVKGKVQARPGNAQNPKLPTGKVEVFALEVEILSISDELPFEISNYSEVGEETRLKYRYLDIRRPQVLNNFYFRHLLYQ
ncbi:MAG: OB-fold nucleic acid binding domain-containing protein, partial [Candidatus Gygaella obscura]|nr:OB-fold nucleic acid binding domain-containing protein [Candidatus Gygaella obscura]